MTNEEKELLLKDLCIRLPYHTFIKSKGESHIQKLIGFVPDIEHYDIKPYLRPMSDMTGKEIYEFIQICDTVLWLGDKRSTCILSLEQMDWLNAHHFDYRGLIEKGLALEAPEGMYK